MKAKINNTDLTPGQLIMVTGKIGYSHISKVITGDELQADMKRRESMGIAPITTAYSTITLYDAEVVCKGERMTIDEQYINERLYNSSNEKHTGKCISIYNKTESLPQLYKIDGTTLVKVETNGLELKQGLKVNAFIRVYAGGNGIGVSLESVACIDEVKFHVSMKSGYSDFGFNFEDAAYNKAEEQVPEIEPELPFAE